MNFLPYRKFEIETYLSRTKSIECFRQAVFTSRPWGYSPGPMDFLAKIRHNHFTARRLVEVPFGYGRRSSNVPPTLYGQFLDTPTGTVLIVKIFPNILSLVLTGFASVITLYLFVQELYSRIITGHSINDYGDILICAVVSFIFYILPLTNLDPETKKAETFLKEIY